MTWVALVILSMESVGGPAYLVVVAASGLGVHVLVDARHPGRRARSPGHELLVMVTLYALVLAVLFAGVQFSITLWGYDLPQPVDWVPLLFMALVVGVFESIFFRGFIQTRLQERWGDVPGVLAAAAAYGAYHVGYGMGVPEMLFLTGLGVIYATAFALTRSVLVLWPMLTPLGSLFAQLERGDIELPWASIAGFADVLALMLGVLWFARRRIRRQAQAQAPQPDAIRS